VGIRIFHSTDSLVEIAQERPAIAIGNLDGVHLGHQALLASAVASAKKKKTQAGVLTFSPHPQEVLRPTSEGHRLTTDAEKFSLLESHQVDFVFALPFNVVVAAQTPEGFFEQFIKAGVHASSAHVGFDFRFGRARSGDAELLKACGARSGIEVQAIDAVIRNGERVSSSAIRAFLQKGDAVAAASYLGRPYRLSGTVVKGDGRGKTIGVPTANVAFASEKLAPRHGVYSARTQVAGQSYASVVNFGIRPTFKEASVVPRPTLEVHLLDFSQDLYGLKVDVDLLGWIRAERKFDSVDALKTQIQADLATARKGR